MMNPFIIVIIIISIIIIIIIMIIMIITLIITVRSTSVDAVGYRETHLWNLPALSVKMSYK